MSKMMLQSPAFENGGRVPLMYTCDGRNVNPPLSIIGVPENAKSLVLILEDPDAPMGTWDHWVIFDIDPKTTELVEGKEPIGVHGRGTGDNITYMGPCPPTGVHNYVFKLFALDIVLGLHQGATKNVVLAAMDGHVLDETKLVASYGRPQTHEGVL